MNSLIRAGRRASKVMSDRRAVEPGKLSAVCKRPHHYAADCKVASCDCKCHKEKEHALVSQR